LEQPQQLVSHPLDGCELLGDRALAFRAAGFGPCHRPFGRLDDLAQARPELLLERLAAAGRPLGQIVRDTRAVRFDDIVEVATYDPYSDGTRLPPRAEKVG
jgi:hypothetical protein